MPETCDVIVLGLGGIGSAAFDQLARRGACVIGIEQFHAAHDRGSSHGETRIIRKAYFEHPDYVPLLLRAYEHWFALQRERGRALLHSNGLILVGPAEGEAIAGTKLARARHTIPLDDLSHAEANERFPELRIPAGFDCVFEPDAGFLEVESCVRAMIDRGIHSGGRARFDETVRHWSAKPGTVSVTTDRDTYSASTLVIAAGAWAAGLVQQLGVPLEVVRKPVMWFAKPVASRPRPWPCFYVELAEGAFYGVPSPDGRTVKVAEHTGGQCVADPAVVDRNLHLGDVEPVTRFLERCLPRMMGPVCRHSVCLYTLTPDRHFLVDHLGDPENVIVAAGFSGHGFKFAPVIGEALADLALNGSSTLPIGFLGRGRFPVAGRSAPNA